MFEATGPGNGEKIKMNPGIGDREDLNEDYLALENIGREI